MLKRLIFLLSLALLSTPLQAATIAVPENVAPWGLTSDLPEGHRGIYADLASAVAQRSKIPIKIAFVPYGRMLEGVRSGEFDYAFGVISPITAAAAPFTTVIAQVPMVAVARKGLPLKTVADLHGFADVGYLRGGSCGGLIDSDPAIHRSSQDSYDLAIRKLAIGRLDGWCSIKAGFLYSLKMTGLADKMGDQLDYGAVQIGLQVTHDKLHTAEADRISALVEGLVKDGAVGDIFIRYVGTAYKP